MEKYYEYKYIYKDKEYASIKTEEELISNDVGMKNIYYFVPWKNRFDYEERDIKPEKVREYGNTIEKIKV